jgi:hypothetical protein
LDGERADRAGRAKDENGVSGSQPERVDGPKRRQTCRRRRTGVAKLQSLRDAADVGSIGYGELCIEPALRIAELVSVDAIANSHSAHACAFGDDDAGAVDPWY